MLQPEEAAQEQAEKDRRDQQRYYEQAKRECDEEMRRRTGNIYMHNEPFSVGRSQKR